jgi:hypothetical protein
MKKFAFVILAALMTTGSHASVPVDIDCSYIVDKISEGMRGFKYYDAQISSGQWPDEVVEHYEQYQRDISRTTNMLTNVYNTFCK